MSSAQTTIGERLASIRERIVAACARVGRDPTAVQLVAVSKRKPADLIRAAHAAGQRDFGENYAQELAAKAAALADLSDIRWHFVGPLQRNKAKLVVGRAMILHSVDSERQLEAVARQAQLQGLTQQVLLQVNLAGETTKAGGAATEVRQLLVACDALAGVRCIGLMTMPPPVDDPADNAVYFAELARLRDALGGAARLPQLSMGMSDDFEAAIVEGATLVRVGTLIFGPRS